ncbi:hypothetical protein [Cognatilysobacter lacus]|uniref:Uncharacterized protein n=1 Tax=Cognatilysobacter lacus TaxID=1643323 RepID=A0A5D8YSY7_9GAMM|nr:hypothetical protein [Lysobacter lacus]TZF83444.1 hypothetical protein FW784_12975 [Lysobacter lacus]
MRALAFVIWVIVVFLALMGLLTFAMASFLPQTYTPEQLGYAVGRWLFLLLPASLILVSVAFAKCWLPGSRGGATDASGPRA